jgi:uncharacterized protein
MLLNLKEVATKEAPVQLHATVDVTDLLGSRQDIVRFGKAEARLEAVPGGEDVVAVHGTVKLDIEQRCSRCLEPVQQHLNVPFQELFTGSQTAAEEDEELILAATDKIELLPYVEEAIQLGIPYIPLCDEECKGLCPVCGTNRNKAICSCKQEKIDPRLAGLADFFKQS